MDQVPPAQGETLRPHNGSRIEVAVYALAFAVVTAQCVAVTMPGGWLWGADAYAFLPRFALPVGLAISATLLVWCLPRVPRAGHPAGGSSRVRFVARAAGLVVAGLCFWTFRTRHVLLGDGIPISQLLPDTHEIHPREPLASWVQHVFYRWGSGWFARPGTPRTLVVQNSIAVGAVMAGVLFLGVAWALAREVVRVRPAEDPENESWLVAAVGLVLVTQGYVQMFFGYVENYAYPVLIAALYVLLSLRFLRGRGSILFPLAAAAIGVAFDFTAVVLGPSAVVLVIAGLLDAKRRKTVAIEVALLLGLTAVALVWLAAGPLHYPALTNLIAMLASGHAAPGYLLSAPHLRDVLNEHLLVGPFGLLLFLPIALLWLVARTRPNATSVFLLVAGASTAAACWTAADLPMGYARDWDLFSPLAVVLTVAAIALILPLLRVAAARWRVAAVLGVVSLFHSVPWIGLNTSEVMSLERFKTLPLGGGRTETTVAFWYAEHGNRAEARRWLQRSLAIDPENSRALDLAGRIALDERNPRLAIRAYLIAITLRPDKEEFRRQLAIAMDAAGGPATALRELDTLMAGHPDHPGLWFERAMLLRACGRGTESAEARARAIRMLPAVAAFPDSLPRN